MLIYNLSYWAKLLQFLSSPSHIASSYTNMNIVNLRESPETYLRFAIWLVMRRTGLREMK